MVPLGAHGGRCGRADRRRSAVAEPGRQIRSRTSRAAHNSGQGEPAPVLRATAKQSWGPRDSPDQGATTAPASNTPTRLARAATNQNGRQASRKAPQPTGPGQAQLLVKGGAHSRRNPGERSNTNTHAWASSGSKRIQARANGTGPPPRRAKLQSQLRARRFRPSSLASRGLSQRGPTQPMQAGPAGSDARQPPQGSNNRASTGRAGIESSSTATRALGCQARAAGTLSKAAVATLALLARPAQPVATLARQMPDASSNT